MKRINLFLSLSAMVICSGAFAQENIMEENGTFYFIEQKIEKQNKELLELKEEIQRLKN